MMPVVEGGNEGCDDIPGRALRSLATSSRNGQSKPVRGNKTHRINEGGRDEENLLRT
jgi:hypothetical protein